MDDQPAPHSIAYIRRQYEEVRDWYKTADTKAQALIALDGAFLTFVSSSIILDPADVSSVTAAFGSETWVFLTAMVVSLVGSIGAALVCLWSRGLGRASVPQPVNDSDSGSYAPELTWFFGHVEHLDAHHFRQQMDLVTPDVEMRVITNQIHTVSKNVARKHRFLNWSYLLAACSLISLVSAAASYMLRLR